MALERLLIENAFSFNLETNGRLLLESSEQMNVNELWRGAVEPAEESPNGNENQAWLGAVEPAYSPPPPPPPPPPAVGGAGGLTKKQRRNRKRLIVEIDNQFIEVNSQAEAIQLFEQARQVTEEAVRNDVPIKNTAPVRVRVSSRGPEPIPLDLEKQAERYQKTLNQALKQARMRQANLIDKKAEKAAIQLAKDADKQLRADVRLLTRRVRDLEDLIAILAML